MCLFLWQLSLNFPDICGSKAEVSENTIVDFLILHCYFFFSVGVCKMYEEHLKRMNPNSPSITYDISQLFDFIDDLADLSCLV